MDREELRKKYREDPQTKEIIQLLTQKAEKIHLNGLIGAAESFLLDAVVEENAGVHLMVLNDKEEAAYFLNSVESIRDSKKDTVFFPSSSRSPYQIEKTDNANVVMRAEVLNKLSKRVGKVIIVSYPEALVEKVVTKKHLSKNTLEVKVGESYSIDFINELLIEYDFEKVDYVYEPGQFSVRGGIVDVFSFSNDMPFRIEFFGDETDSIRSFDPDGQRSIKQYNRITIVPNIQDRILQESRESILDFLPSTTIVWMKSYDVVSGKLQTEYDKALYAYNKLESTIAQLAPIELYFSKKDFEFAINKLQVIELGSSNHFTEAQTLHFNCSPQPSFNKNFDLLAEQLKTYSKANFDNVIVSSNSKQIERIYKIFEDKEEEVEFGSIQLDIHEGFIDVDKKILCFTDHQIFERYHRFRLKEGFRKHKEAFTLQDLYSLKKGDFVVHVDHGVGEFSGLEKIDVNGKNQEAIRLVYKGSDILYVSIHSLHRISKYTGKEGSEPKLNKLGSPAWSTAKSKTKKKIKEVAFDLIKLYAKRRTKKGFAFSPDTYLQTELEVSFIYEDTPDQSKATLDVKKDMEKPAPMDRLICGDVGFGKTEVAIRAAFKAVVDGKQVAILVPTTILAFQHFKNIRERLKEFPCTVDYINRFKSTAQQRETLKKLSEGKVDILIGTHRIVGKDVEFKDLGLLIIDEEQKFGVGVKDKLKLVKANVDTLTLTATPIPRTLQFSLMGARDLSTINTPPPNRVPIKTILNTFNEEVIRDAISFEIQRGGQVYFVHNKVQNIEEIAGMIQRLCPNAKVAIGHGQMEGKKLETIMLDFIDGVYDVLLATTIIESGIDVPNANTMIINQANHFGLSDLHQLRGRVGRSNKQAFCYLISPPVHTLTPEARKRLSALEQFSDLGSGFNISMRDLDIRGAGNLLGGEQSGFISEIGFDMYQKILKEAIEELKENEFKDLFEKEDKKEANFVKECQIETDLEVLIPGDYVNEISERLKLYQFLNDAEDEKALDAFEAELLDRFGPLPDPTKELLESMRLKWMAMKIGFEKLILKHGKFIGHFIADQSSPFFETPHFTKVIKYLQSNPSTCKMYEKNNILRFSAPNISSIQDALKMIKDILSK